MFSRSILFVLLVVLDFRPCPCHQCSSLPGGFVHATPTKPVSAPPAKPARQHRGTCKKAERTNLNCERCPQVFSVSTKGKTWHPLSLRFHVVRVITELSQSLSHTCMYPTHTHTTDPPSAAGEVTDFAATGSQHGRKLRPPPPQDEIYSKAILLISLSFEL